MDLEGIDELATVEPRAWVPLVIAEVLGLARGSGARFVALYAQGAGFTRVAVLLEIAAAKGGFEGSSVGALDPR